MARNEWYSPAEVVEAARQTMGGIDLDPASCPKANEIVRATKFYTIRDDGLQQPWVGRIWLNPPYGRHAPKFVQRFAQLFADGSIEQGCLLLGTHHLTTKWFGALSSLGPIGCLPEKRLQFSGTTTRPAHGSVIIGVGIDSTRFTAAFSGLGRLCRL